MLHKINPEETLLVACEVSGRVRNAFSKKGVNAVSCDLLPSLSPGWHIQDDIRNYLHYNWRGLIAFPPCTYLTNANNRHKYKEPQLIHIAQQLFLAIKNAPVHHICIENPPGSMNTLFRKPNQIIHPYNFGHKESKPTCLWLKNLPRLNASRIENEINYTIRDMPQTKDRAFKRSLTYFGIAEAMADQWAHYFL